MSSALFCLHGFLGSAEDWNQALPACDGWGSVLAANWLRDPRMSDAGDLVALGEAVNRWARESSPPNTGKRVLLGYSMGGRIALHALLADPGFWDSAVIVSSHPGLHADAQTERLARLEQDLAWARRFETESWDSVIRAWNSQPVFSKDGPPIARAEEPAIRERLAWALEKGSLAKQKDFRPYLSRLDRPVLWIAGEKDEKYLKLAQECASLNPSFRWNAIPETGHRVPWATKQANFAFQKILRNWMNEH